MQTIKNIIFDFGGVFIEVDYKKTERAFAEAGIKNFHELYSQQTASPLFEELETGNISPTQFFSELRKISGAEISDTQIIDCWNKMLGKFHIEAVEWLSTVNNRYRVFLFSNTNAIHYECFNKIYQQQFGKNDFENQFEEVYYSHKIGLRKPYKKAFEFVLKDNRLLANETVFIDDTISNIEGAKVAGLETIFLESPNGVWQLGL